MKTAELNALGFYTTSEISAVRKALAAGAARGMPKSELRRLLAAIAQDPHSHTDHPTLAEVAAARLQRPENALAAQPRTSPIPWQSWGTDIDPQAKAQMQSAATLPIAVGGALMPDAHVGYGLPIGGVLATRNAVIPYAVGVDIACRMKLTVLDLPHSALDDEKQRDRLINAIERRTRFGMGARFEKPHHHDVLDHDWTISPVTRRLKDKARTQLGTSGSGNHFVEFGTLTIHSTHTPTDDLPLEPGTYLALLSHSGSRGTGAAVCNHYARLATQSRPELPKHLRHLAWLDMDTEPGREYWAAMNLMGEYASANHALIHASIAEHLGAQVIAGVENHHNFAWKERHVIDGTPQDVIVHRKGATPADKGTLGVIPGSMATPGFVVRGRGVHASLHSASHGAGRAMSRTKARNTYRWHHAQDQLRHARVTLLSAGLDEVPMAYKDIHSVMNAQQDLIDIIAQFDPRLVKMAPEGEKPED